MQTGHTNWFSLRKCRTCMEHYACWIAKSLSMHLFLGLVLQQTGSLEEERNSSGKEASFSTSTNRCLFMSAASHTCGNTTSEHGICTICSAQWCHLSSSSLLRLFLLVLVVSDIYYRLKHGWGKLAYHGTTLVSVYNFQEEQSSKKANRQSS